MKLLQRRGWHRHEVGNEDDGVERPLPDEAPLPQPEHEEPLLVEPEPTALSKRDYLAILWRAIKEFRYDNMTNIAYERDEQRGFIRRRLAALTMVVFALIGFALAFGVLVLGSQLSTWIGNALGATSIVKIVWYVAEWPLLIGGLMVTFGGLMHYGPNVQHPRWRFLTLDWKSTRLNSSH